MKSRCLNPNRPNYYLYGGRGIKVCERWFDFTNFLEDMGEKPKGYQLDRINTDGNYEPNNCRWVTPKENSNNRRVPEDVVVGKTFGGWFTLKQVKQRDSSGGLKYLCRCSCGYETNVRKRALLEGTSKRCVKCANNIYAKTALDLIGKKFNQWIVVSILEERSSCGRIQYTCRCSCGFETKMVRDRFESGRSRSCQNCAAYNRPYGICKECGCHGHKNIDLETSTCDLLGFCSKCDNFRINDYLKGADHMKSYNDQYKGR
jgi:hypothetical protein